jgi:hypothetical protein
MNLSVAEMTFLLCLTCLLLVPLLIWACHRLGQRVDDARIAPTWRPKPRELKR